MPSQTLEPPAAQAVPLNFTQTECPLAAFHGSSNLREVAATYGSGPYDRTLFGLSQCDRCGLGLTSPIPSPEDSSALYADRTSNDFQPDAKGLVADLKAFFAKRDAARFARFSPQASSILDYACGNGAFTLALGRIRPQARVFGCDYHQTPPPGIPAASYLSYSELASRRDSFDLIVARHVLEHTYAPVDFLRELRGLTASNGVLAIEVPSFDTPLRRIFGKYWDGNYVPYHPLHFTRHSLALAVEAAGFEVLATGTAEMPKMGRSLRNITGGAYTSFHFAAGVALQPVQVLTGLVTGTSVCLRVMARKR
jgi:SAM-dependent methyltransferase